MDVESERDLEIVPIQDDPKGRRLLYDLVIDCAKMRRSMILRLTEDEDAIYADLIEQPGAVDTFTSRVAEIYRVGVFRCYYNPDWMKRMSGLTKNDETVRTRLLFDSVSLLDLSRKLAALVAE